MEEVVQENEALKVRPMGNLVFLEWEEAPSVWDKSGLIRPDSYRAMHYTGTVISIGPDVWELEVGDRVFFDQFPNDHSIENKFQEGDKRYAFIPETWIHAKIEDRTLGVGV